MLLESSVYVLCSPRFGGFGAIISHPPKDLSNGHQVCLVSWPCLLIHLWSLTWQKKRNSISFWKRTFWNRILHQTMIFRFQIPYSNFGMCKKHAEKTHFGEWGFFINSAQKRTFNAFLPWETSHVVTSTWWNTWHAMIPCEHWFVWSK